VRCGLLSVFPLEVLLEECEEGVGRGCGYTGATATLEELFREEGKVHTAILLVRGRVKVERRVVSRGKQSGFE
jgi:hypothetical protein